LAATTAAKRYALPEASELLEHVLELSQRLRTSERRSTEVEVLRKLSVMYALSYTPKAVKAYERLVEVARDHQVPAAAWRVLWTPADVIMEIGRNADAKKLRERAYLGARSLLTSIPVNEPMRRGFAQSAQERRGCVSIRQRHQQKGHRGFANPCQKGHLGLVVVTIT
jgi:hypothetical protein